MKFKSEDVKEVLNCDVGDTHEGLKLIQQGDWVSDHKYDYRTSVIEHDGKFYEVNEGRSGSYHTEYNYDSEDWDEDLECPEVVKVEVVRHEWKAI